MTEVIVAAALCLLALQVWKHLMVIAFFRRQRPVRGRPPVGRSTVQGAGSPMPVRGRPPASLVTILQPILSGDPTLEACLARTLEFECSYPLEIIWLLDASDDVAHALCRALSAKHPSRPVRIVAPPPPAADENPKMVKLIAGALEARGDVLCVLDDDTQLPDYGLEQCLPYLDQPGVGLAFGLPYYLSFQNLWSRLVAYFVNSNSLLTYIPYTRLSEPLTINGMFYAIRRPVLDAVGGFEGLEHILSDDFAVAQRFRAHGWRLCQTPLRHGISTFVTGPRQYAGLLQRWLVFPRESLMRHLPRRGLLLLYLFVMLPAFVPLLLVVAALLFPTPPVLLLTSAYFVYSYLIFAHFNATYLAGGAGKDSAPRVHAPKAQAATSRQTASGAGYVPMPKAQAATSRQTASGAGYVPAPWRHSWLVPVVQLILPIQLLVALLGPPQVVWRGKLVRVARGGGFQRIERSR